MASPGLTAWCARHLGSPAREVRWQTAHSSVVSGMLLADGRAVVVKIRPGADRLLGCAEVHRHLFAAGFPCPEPLVGPVPYGETGLVASAEAEIPSDALDPVLPPAAAFAALLAELIRLAPAQVPSLTPAPPWIRWHHDEGPIWPRPDDRDTDLHTVPAPFLDDLARRVRTRLSALSAPPVVGHCDFESHNLWWRAGRPLAVHDWDSAVTEPVPVIVGVASAMWPAGGSTHAATVAQSEAFLTAYQSATRPFSPTDLEAAWAAGLWVRAFNARKALLDGHVQLTPEEAATRATHAGL